MLREIYVIIGYIIDVFQGLGVMIFNILVDICAGIVLFMLSLKILFPMINNYFSRQTCHSRSMNYLKVGEYSFQCGPTLKFSIAFVSTFPYCFFIYPYILA